MSEQQFEWSKIKPLLPDSFYLTHAEGDLKGYPKLCQSVVSTNSLDPVFDEFERHDFYPTTLSYEKELIEDALRKNAFSPVSIIMDLFKDEIESHIYEHNKSDCTEVQLFKNTREIIMFYDLGYEMEPDSWKWKQPRINKEIAAIKSVLKIPKSNKEFDKDLEMMILQSTYGGNLVLYFRPVLADACTLDDNDYQSLVVNGTVNVAIIDLAGGSGDFCEVKLYTSFPFDRDNLKVCEAMAYSFTYNVCFLVESWCDNSKVSFSHAKVRGRKKKDESVKSTIYDKEIEYDKTFASGKCTFGDINFSRHRDTYYVTDYPMGNKCPHCGQFWID